MPRAKKPAHAVADSRNGSALALVAGTTVAVPRAPAGLRVAGKNAWLGYWSSPMAQVSTQADVVVVTRYAKAVDEYFEAMKAFEKERTVDGSQGQPRLNPLATWITSREQVLVALEDRLGLSPLARMKLGLAIGEAHRSLSEMNASLVEDLTTEGASTDGADDYWQFD